MDLLKTCVFITVVTVMLLHSSVSASILKKTLDNGNILSMTIQKDPSPMKRTDFSLLLHRLRRNTAQWYIGSHHFNDHNHERTSRRWNHRRNNPNYLGGGQVVDA